MIPHQYKGARSATAYTVKASGSAEADWLFEKAKKNLLNVNRWQELAGRSTAGFKVINKHNKETNDVAEEGNYLRINIPVVPGINSGNGYDWVKVEKIEEKQGPGYRFIGMRVRPCAPPFDRHEVAHFFSPHATSTFCIERKGKKVKAAVYGRNENPNTRANKFFDKIRNIIVAIGAMIGLNKSQWKSLVKGWIEHSVVETRYVVLAEE
jgi:hypothetical protein